MAHAWRGRAVQSYCRGSTRYFLPGIPTTPQPASLGSLVTTGDQAAPLRAAPRWSAGLARTPQSDVGRTNTHVYRSSSKFIRSEASPAARGSVQPERGSIGGARRERGGRGASDGPITCPTHFPTLLSNVAGVAPSARTPNARWPAGPASAPRTRRVSRIAPSAHRSLRRLSARRTPRPSSASPAPPGSSSPAEVSRSRAPAPAPAPQVLPSLSSSPGILPRDELGCASARSRCARIFRYGDAHMSLRRRAYFATPAYLSSSRVFATAARLEEHSNKLQQSQPLTPPILPQNFRIFWRTHQTAISPRRLI